ncbi:MAG: LapA family protein [Mesorhizobium sp.]
MVNRIFLVVIVVPVAVILIALAVANRAPATFTIDPFNPGNPGLTLQLPLFAMLFLALALGMLVGSFATWMSQGRYRRDAKSKDKEVRSLMQEISQRKAAQPQPQPARTSAPALPAPRV